jgi:hypothetical protein
MSGEAVGKPAISLFERLIGRLRPPWVIVAVGMLLIVVPLATAYLDGVLDELFRGDLWRVVYLPSAVILYIFFIGPILDRMQDRVIEAFRPVVLLDSDAFQRLVAQATRSHPVVELVAFGAGAFLGLWMSLTGLEIGDAPWLRLWLIVSESLMFGLLGWTVFGAVRGTRLTSALHRQPLAVDLFDVRPFEPVGRQSLAISLAFIGGILLSVIFGLGVLDLYAWENWLFYLLLASFAVLVFFLNMRDTHRVLAAAKERELEAVQRRILQASRALMDRIAGEESSGSLAAEINALAVYEDRLHAARTWPYNTAMLRTLFFSLIIPGAAELAKVVFRLLF